MISKYREGFLVIPASDIIGGKCVRLCEGRYDSVREYSANPADVAKMFADNGFERLHIVDLEGAASGSPQNLKTVEKIAKSVTIEIQFGGGIKSLNDATSAISAGVRDLICGSVAVTNPSVIEDILLRYGRDRVIVGADVREDKVAIKGWKEQTNNNIIDVIKSVTTLGVAKIICTDISKDGMLKGPALDLYKKLRIAFPEIWLIASGGVSSLDDVIATRESLSDGVIVGKAFYEGLINQKEVLKWLRSE
jgi:phosphoribosylformimino-5-aminoimidazole carboxamide ribotide isomerase